MLKLNSLYELKYKEGTDEEVTFKCKKVTVGDKSQIYDLNAEMRAEGEVDMKLGGFSLALIERSIVGWEGIVDDKNKPIPFKIELVKELPSKLYEFLIDGINRVNELVETEESKVKEKN
jgi:hypothetical protein